MKMHLIYLNYFSAGLLMIISLYYLVSIDKKIKIIIIKNQIIINKIIYYLGRSNQFFIKKK